MIAVEPTIARVEMPDGRRAWHFSRYADVKALLTDQRLTMFLPDGRSAGWDNDSKVHQILVRQATGRRRGVMSDAEDRVLRRRIMNKMFSGPNVLRVTPTIRTVADELVRDMAAQSPPVDLGRSFSGPLCLRTVSELLGVPSEDAVEFPSWTQAAEVQTLAAMRRFMSYVHKMIAERKRDPRDDVVTQLLEPSDDADELHERRLVNLLAWMLSLGWQGPASCLDLAVALLLTTPDQYRLLRDDPSLVSGAVEEVVRMFNSQGATDGMSVRIALKDIEFGGITIEAGETVLVDVWGANRDGAVFDNPNRFDLTRSPNPHLGFGNGVYMCNFARAARAELGIGISALVSGLPGLRLSEPADQLEYINPERPLGVVRLPVTW